MYALAKIDGFKEGPSDNPTDTQLKITIPNKLLGELLCQKHIHDIEIRLDDGRTITNEQRKKAYAIMSDIAKYTGAMPEEVKAYQKFRYYAFTGNEHISLKDCSVSDARVFINQLLDFCLENGIPLSEEAINLTDDMGRYLYYCLIHKKCCICGRPGELHHVDAIGSGRNRNKIDDSKMRKMSLCREHHTAYHKIGRERFERMYHVQGIIFQDPKEISMQEYFGNIEQNENNFQN